MSGQAYAVVIAVEEYQEDGINPVEFARNDATAFKEILIRHLGVPEDNIEIWIDTGATRTRLEHELPYSIRQLRLGDRFYLFYAGHGLWAGGSNRLTAWDTHPHHPAETTVDLEKVLLAPLRASPCQQSLVFVDACAAEFDDPHALGRNVLAGMKKSEFDAFVSDSIHTAAFFSCSPRQKSYPAATLSHGIWTYHLLRALRGEEPAASVRGVVTGQSLQDYLGVAVPKFLREKTSIKGLQRPYALIGSGGAFEIRRMPRKARTAAADVLRPDFASAFFRGIETRPFARLPGFDRKRGHTVPDSRNDRAAGWAGRLLDEEVKEELDAVYKNARRILDLPRGEVSLNVDDGCGSGTVDTDSFRFSVDVEQDSADIENAAIVRTVVLRVPHAELPEDFDDIFPSVLNEIVVPFKGASKNYDDLADSLESFAKTAKASFDDNPRKEKIVLTFGAGLSVVVDAARSTMLFSMDSATGCLEMIQELGQGAMPRLIGDMPGLIGGPA
jgi:hypothetical protein